MFFPLVMYGCESWTIKKGERQRIAAFELWCCRRLLRVPCTTRRSNQSVLKKINPNIHWKDWCWSWNSNTLATWCEELTHWKRPWCWERLKAGREGDDRGQDGWMALLTQWTWVWANSGRWWRAGRPGLLQSMGLQRVAHNWPTEQQQLQFPKCSSLCEPTTTFLLYSFQRNVEKRGKGQGKCVHGHFLPPCTCMLRP